MAKLDSTTASAVSLYARLQGIDTSSKSSSVESEVDVEVIDIDKTQKKSKPKTKSAPKENVEPRQILVPELEKFSKLNRNVKINVQQSNHEIHYKEQIWNIPSRTIEYKLEVVTNQKISKDIAMIFKDNTPEALKMAEDGEVRYIKIVSYENIPYRSREIGYIKVFCDDRGGLKTKAIFRNTAMKENNINADKVKRSVEKVRDQLLGR